MKILYNIQILQRVATELGNLNIKREKRGTQHLQESSKKFHLWIGNRENIPSYYWISIGILNDTILLTYVLTKTVYFTEVVTVVGRET